jgi:hypothetical protein
MPAYCRHAVPSVKGSNSEISPVTVKRAMDIRNRPRIPIPDEDPYSVAGSGGSSGSSGVGTGTSGTANGSGMVAATREQLLQQQQQLLQRRSDKPPKLPPRDNNYPHDIPKVSETTINVNGHSHVSHHAVCLTTVPQPLPKRVLYSVRSSASSFSFQYLLFSLRLLVVACVFFLVAVLCIFHSITYFRREF